MSDNLLQKAKREKLVRTLTQNLSLDNRVLEAIAQVPRHLFIDKSMDHIAYEDKP